MPPSAPAPPPVRVVFIAGYGRSGSTLLSRLLGRVDGFAAVGEVRHLWEKGVALDELCGCGERFHVCPFWSEVLEAGFGGLPRQRGAEILALKRTVERPRLTPQVRYGLGGARWRERTTQYAALLQRLYDATAAVSGADALVDSTKDPTHGFLLARMPGIELHVVHLVRDSRATAHSWTRRRERPEVHWKRQLMPLRNPVDAAARWSAANALSELLDDGRAASYQRIRYEDLATEPDAVLGEVVAAIAPDRSAPRLAEAAASFDVDHTVAGNPFRFQQGQVAIRLDDAWRTEMDPAQRRTVTALTAPLLLRYGYDL